jgi:hypothetical protein
MATIAAQQLGNEERVAGCRPVDGPTILAGSVANSPSTKCRFDQIAPSAATTATNRAGWPPMTVTTIIA